MRRRTQHTSISQVNSMHSQESGKDRRAVEYLEASDQQPVADPLHCKRRGLLRTRRVESEIYKMLEQNASVF